jgi:hypothetical protein
LPPFFPVEAWPKSDECPYPVDGANRTNWARHRDAGIDTLYMRWRGACGASGADVVNSGAAVDAGLHVLLSDDFVDRSDFATQISDLRAVAAFMTGDESDGDVYLDDGSSKAAQKADDARLLWDAYPTVPVYNGAMTNRNVGAFAGMADIQGIDFYVGACAPHVTPWGSNPPLRASYDYLRNTRDNHAPLSTWMYAQGLHDGWNKSTPLGLRVFQPDPHEIAVQAMMVVAAGGKGLMWFQSQLSEADRAPARWAALADASHMVGAVRELLRTADVTGAAHASTGADNVLVEALRGPDAVVVPVINLFATTSVTDVNCGLAQVAGVPAPPHWILGSQQPDVVVDIADEAGVADVFAVEAGGVVDVDARFDRAARTVTIPAVGLDDDTPVRLFVLAADAAVRGRVVDAFVP